MNRRRWWSFLLVILAVSTSSCAYYSFTGAALPQHLHTIAVPLAQNQSGSSVPGLASDLTSLLVNRFVDRTRLTLASSAANADAVLDSDIQTYTNRPTSVGGAQRAQLNRVTIRVSVEYVDQVRDSVLLSQSFSAFSDYDPAQGLEGEESAASDALESIADDIFSRATSRW